MKKIDCIAQDPDFTELDEAFLETCDIDIVQDPQGFAAINENTLVFMIGGIRSLAEVMSRGPYPAAMILTTLRDGAPDYFKAMVKYCEVIGLPGCAKDSEDMPHESVYWRHSRESTS